MTSAALSVPSVERDLPPMTLPVDRSTAGSVGSVGSVGSLVDAAALDRLYAHPAPAGRSWLRTSFVSTLDGAASGPDGVSGSLGGDADHAVFATLRAHADAVLVGSSTARAEQYRGVDLEPWQAELRASLGLAPYPLLVIITGSLSVGPELSPREGEGPIMVVTGDDHGSTEVDRLTDAGLEVVPLAGGVELGVVVDLLRDRGLPRVLAEGGPGVHRSLLAAGLVDELCLTLAPTAVGGDQGRITSGDALDPPVAYALQHVLQGEDGALLARYLVDRENR